MRFRATEEVVSRIEVDCAVDVDLDVTELSRYNEIVVTLTPPSGRTKTVRFRPEEFIPLALQPLE